MNLLNSSPQLSGDFESLLKVIVQVSGPSLRLFNLVPLASGVGVSLLTILSQSCGHTLNPLANFQLFSIVLFHKFFIF